jgi:hypothetical protein
MYCADIRTSSIGQPAGKAGIDAAVRSQTDRSSALSRHAWITPGHNRSGNAGSIPGLSASRNPRFHVSVRVVAAVLAFLAVVFIIVAVAGMVTGRPGDRVGGLIRILALALFVAAVVLNVASR